MLTISESFKSSFLKHAQIAKKEEEKINPPQTFPKTVKSPHRRGFNDAIVRNTQMDADVNYYINYTKADGTTSQRKVKPLAAKNDLLIAYDHSRGAFRSFKLERIGSAQRHAVSQNKQKRKQKKIAADLESCDKSTDLESCDKSTDLVSGGKADGIPDKKFDKKLIDEGAKVEREHTTNKTLAREIAKDHLKEHKDYYAKLKKLNL